MGDQLLLAGAALDSIAGRFCRGNPVYSNPELAETSLGKFPLLFSGAKTKIPACGTHLLHPSRAVCAALAGSRVLLTKVRQNFTLRDFNVVFQAE